METKIRPETMGDTSEVILPADVLKVVDSLSGEVLETTKKELLRYAKLAINKYDESTTGLEQMQRDSIYSGLQRMYNREIDEALEEIDTIIIKHQIEEEKRALQAEGTNREAA